MLETIRRKIAAWQALASWEKRALVALSAHLHLIWVRLRVTRFDHLHHWHERHLNGDAKPMPHGCSDLDFARRSAELIEICARHGLYHANCLHQSLVLCAWLRRYGLAPELRVGITPDAGPFQAHAWVELNQVLLNRNPDGYLPFDHRQWSAKWSESEKSTIR